MQFKNPEVLYFLALLIIPILVHLFQLQKFKKTSFTNVDFLQKLVLQTRKSSILKKWLILCTRLLLLTAVIIAFAQPYFSLKETNEKQRNFIYLDNSLSMSAEGASGKLLPIATQTILENISNDDSFSLLTNANFYKDISSSVLKSVLLKVTNTPKKRSINDILLKIEATHKDGNSSKNILISDFQNVNTRNFKNTSQALTLVPQLVSQTNNLAIDSVFITANNATSFTLKVLIKNQGVKKENIPIAILNDQKLVNKQSFSIEENGTKELSFSIQKQAAFLGKIQLTHNDAFSFDNVFYFAINNTQKINVLSIGKTTDFLSKIYTSQEFNFTSTTVKNTNYNTIQQQQLIIVNELKEIPLSLIASLTEFSKKGGHLVIIPNANSNTASYNLFLKSLKVGKIAPKKTDSLKITAINFSHPLLQDVFSKKVQNFQYPIVQSYYPSSFKRSSNVLSFENTTAFVKSISVAHGKLYWIASSLTKSNSNFTNSPLVVPLFYNFGQQSLHPSKLYYTIDNLNTIDIHSKPNKNTILRMQGNETTFIPLQQKFQNKVVLSTLEQPLIAGFYKVLNEDKIEKTIAFNYAKEESSLQFLNSRTLSKTHKNITSNTSIKDVFQKINTKNEVHWLWKWFLALAIVSLLLEIFILKFFKS
ncbi:BatA domain-containing protein [Tenacibaculum maritimum]|uniref:BatA domain-containing protein n=1 Tax=Tenacibaculum maritimum TaxID=107401 RepID=UPI00388E308C